MTPSIGLKFLRDGVDSGNVMAAANDAQDSFNFFKSSMDS